MVKPWSDKINSYLIIS